MYQSELPPQMLNELIVVKSFGEIEVEIPAARFSQTHAYRRRSVSAVGVGLRKSCSWYLNLHVCDWCDENSGSTANDNVDFHQMKGSAEKTSTGRLSKAVQAPADVFVAVVARRMM